MLPVGELAAAHPVEQIEVFLDGTVPVWAFRARLRQRARLARISSALWLSTYALPSRMSCSANAYN